uniref:Uncharacterized protein n=1 Tax=Romanomermis culicivorax TaxID=13658 RepID=A0A915IF92_ROMCU
MLVGDERVCEKLKDRLRGFDTIRGNETTDIFLANSDSLFLVEYLFVLGRISSMVSSFFDCPPATPFAVQ